MLTYSIFRIWISTHGTLKLEKNPKDCRNILRSRVNTNRCRTNNCLELCLLCSIPHMLQFNLENTVFSERTIVVFQTLWDFVWSEDMLSAPCGKMTSVLTKNPLDITLMQTLPSLHLTKHTSYSHLACPRNLRRHLPAISTMPSGWASNNVISVTITKRGIWFITRISYNPLQEDTKSVHTFMSYSVPTGGSSPLKVFWHWVNVNLLNSIQSSDKKEDQHLKWK